MNFVKKKVIVLHPPMYPVNYEFYNHLGNLVDLLILQFGEYPSDHTNWTAANLKDMNKSFELVIIGKGADSYKNQLHLLFIRQINTFKPDIVLSIAFWFPSLIISFIKKSYKFKSIILTNAHTETEKKSSYLRSFLRKIISKRTDCFISASFLTTEFLKSINIKSNIKLSKQTIDINLWRNEIESLPNKSNLRKTLNLPENKIIILGIGNFSQGKNWQSVLTIIKKFDDCIFLLIGDGAERESYLRYIEDHNLLSKVIIKSKKEGLELKSYYKAADIFILPSLLETYGFVVVEALSSKLPVLCTKYAGASCLIKDGYNGYVIDPKEDYSQLIKKVINNHSTISPNCIDSIKELTIENRAKEFYEIFEDVLSK